MNIKIVLTEIRRTPMAFLSSKCVCALEVFLAGYRSADSSVQGIWEQLAKEFGGSDSGNACTRAYLSSPSSEIAFERVLDAFDVLLRRVGIPQPVPEIFAKSTLIGLVKDAITQGRPIIVLGEPTVVALRDFFCGYLIGLSAVYPEEGARQERRLAAFESWIREDFGYSAPWYAIIRANYGMCESGLKKFVELWDRFEREVPEVAP